MNRDEILKASREENRDGDERERYIEMRSELAAVMAMVITLVVLIIISIIRGRDIMPLVCVMSAGGAGEMIGKYVNNHNVITLVGGIIFTVLLAVTLISCMCGQTFIVHTLWDSFFH